ncbi:ATPase [Mariniradius saccharolyticus AK6]|uniref:ATPase n=1 Tax=Mariniradius saccharolyticus AK6 TaxID=1239962 RepID=M7XB37_9BACT|nr:AAA family ATPase [Mariniradius saccharolyticus]EMS31818.1 ATPase [Mariniradius saccharolyticus AK6]
MERLIEKSERKANLNRNLKRRYLYEQIGWDQRLIMVLGYRGTGKTTLLLQYLSSIQRQGIYLSLDDFFFETNRLVPTVDTLYGMGYRVFLLDEVHRYAWWSKDIKQLHDDFPDIQVVATGSSILDISKGSADLSRRASVYHLEGLSFREYLNFNKGLNLTKLGLQEILSNHHVLGPQLLDTFDFHADFQDYLRYGYFPFFLESGNSYQQQLQETIQLVIDTDIAPFEELQHATTRTMKKLLFVLSESVPFTPNINKLAEKLETQRNTILRLLDILGQARILQLLKTSTKGISYLQKPEKIYLHNPNFIYLFSPNMANIGNVRETFFFNQVGAVHSVTAPKFGDFIVDDAYLFEVGGASKTGDQIRGIPNAYLALDVEGGGNNRIPLWLFGMLY